MKKAITSFILLLMIITLIACEPQTDDPSDDTTAPMITGVTDKQIRLNDSFNPLDGVRAIDDVDGDITSRIVVTGSVNVEVADEYQLTYKVSDDAGNEASASRVITVLSDETSDLHVVNGDFSKPLEGTWNHWAGEGGVSTVSIVDGVAVVDITANGTYWYSTQFSQPNLTITQGKMYRLEFDAKADVARGIVIKIEDSSYYGYIDELFTLTNQMTKYSIEFFVIKPTITNGKLNIGLGNMSSRGTDAGALTKVYLDNFVFTEIEAGVDDVPPVIHNANDKTIAVNDAFDPLEGISVSDNRDVNLSVDDIVITGSIDITKAGEYTLTYTLEDASGNTTVVNRVITVLDGLVPSTLQIINGDFEVDQLSPVPQPAATGWGWHGAGAFSIAIQNGVAKIDITNIGTVVHGVQFYQQNRVITQGQIYKVTFDAKADIPRPIMFALEEGTTRRYDEIVHLETGWNTYEIYIEYVLTGFENGKFAFFMGDVGDNSVPTTVYMDNISVVSVDELVDNTAPQLYGMHDYIIAKDSVFNPLQGVTIRDNVDILQPEDIIVTGVVNTSAVGTYTIEYKVTDKSGNEATYSRVIHVINRDDLLDNTFILGNSDFSTDQSDSVADAWNWKNSGAGAFTVAIENGIAKVNVTNLGTVPHGVQFFQQNRIIETGATYKVSFKAKADLPRSFRLSLEAGTDVRFFQIIDITSDWETYEVYITPTGGGFTNGKFGLFLGYIDDESVLTTFYFDDFLVELVGYRKDNFLPMIIGANDVVIKKDSEFNALTGIQIFDNQDKFLKVSDIVVTGEVNTALVGEYTLEYKLTDSQNNTTTVFRTVTVEE